MYHMAKEKKYLLDGLLLVPPGADTGGGVCPSSTPWPFLGGALEPPRGLERKNPMGTNIGKSPISDNLVCSITFTLYYYYTSYLYNACHIDHNNRLFEIFNSAIKKTFVKAKSRRLDYGGSFMLYLLTSSVLFFQQLIQTRTSRSFKVSN